METANHKPVLFVGEDGHGLSPSYMVAGPFSSATQTEDGSPASYRVWRFGSLQQNISDIQKAFAWRRDVAVCFFAIHIMPAMNHLDMIKLMIYSRVYKLP